MQRRIFYRWILAMTPGAVQAAMHYKLHKVIEHRPYMSRLACSLEGCELLHF